MSELDVLIVGAGLSGIGAAYRLHERGAPYRYAIFEARDAIGGTWDLFRYPGVRSDSDMATLGFAFHPWHGGDAIAGGEAIRDYIRETAATFGIDAAVRLRHRVIAADWSSEQARWTVRYIADGDERQVRCRFLFLCAGYYDYASAHAPDWPGRDTFVGPVIHPQFWPGDLDVAGKRIAVVGSGATAVTLLPALVARGAARVTMVQRSPTYIVARPAQDALAARLHRWLPRRAVAAAVRWTSIVYAVATYGLSRRWPGFLRRRIAAQQRRLLGSGFDIATHLTPRYAPWDQRLCLAPDGDLFAVLRDGRASIVTGTIESVQPDGLAFTSGETLAADIIVTATGLTLQVMGGARLSVDGVAIDPGKRLLYRGAMLDGVPNLAFAIGYTNASWTLRSDLTARFVRRLLDHMTTRGLGSATPVAATTDAPDAPILDLSSGYIQRGTHLLPRQGRRAPWRVHQNYLKDLWSFRTLRLDDGVLRFGQATGGEVALAGPAPVEPRPS